MCSVFIMIVQQTSPSSGWTAPFNNIRWVTHTCNIYCTTTNALHGQFFTLLLYKTMDTFVLKRILLSSRPWSAMFNLHHHHHHHHPLLSSHLPESELSWSSLYSSHTSTLLSGCTLAAAASCQSSERGSFSFSHRERNKQHCELIYVIITKREHNLMRSM